MVPDRARGMSRKGAIEAQGRTISLILLSYKYFRSKVFIPQRLGGNKPSKSLILKDRWKGV
jgi:hypothetical protein